MARLRIAYVGLPLGALALAQAGFRPELIGLGHPDAPGARRVRRQLSRQALVLARPDLHASEVRAAFASVKPDVLLSWFWPQRIPEALLALPPLGAYGVHPSLLPRWRGPDPYFWALYEGDAETGVTLHRLDAEYDTGELVSQQRLAIDPRENAWALARRLDRLGLRLLVEAAARLSRDRALPGVAQDERAACPAPAPHEELLSIDWHADASSVVRLVHAAAPYPGAAAELADELVDVLDAELFEGSLPAALEPADAVLVGERLVVKAAVGAVVVTRVRTEAGRELRAAELPALFGEALARV